MQLKEFGGGRYQEFSALQMGRSHSAKDFGASERSTSLIRWEAEPRMVGTRTSPRLRSTSDAVALISAENGSTPLQVRQSSVTALRNFIGRNAYDTINKRSGTTCDINATAGGRATNASTKGRGNSVPAYSQSPRERAFLRTTKRARNARGFGTPTRSHPALFTNKWELEVQIPINAKCCRLHNITKVNRSRRRTPNDEGSRTLPRTS